MFLNQNNPPNPLKEYFKKNNGRLIYKWMHYFDIYHRHFYPFREKKVTILEFGVWHGGSLQMWKHYFGGKARIIGVDIDPRCKNLEEKQIEVYIGDQENRIFLKELIKKIGSIDVVIDDGGHYMKQQIATFEEVFPVIRNEGIYLVEDLHTSYWKKFNGGYKKKGTFIEYAKNIIDSMHAWHSSNQEIFKINDHTHTVKGMHVYDSVIVFEKNIVKPPHTEKKGNPSF